MLWMCEFFNNMVSHTHTTTTSTIYMVTISVAAQVTVLIGVIPFCWISRGFLPFTLTFVPVNFLGSGRLIWYLVVEKFHVCNFRGYWQPWNFLAAKISRYTVDLWRHVTHMTVECTSSGERLPWCYHAKQNGKPLHYDCMKYEPNMLTLFLE